MATSVSGKGCIPDAHPLAVGWGYGKQGTRAAEAAFKDVDLVLAVGVRYSEVSTASYAIPRHDMLDPRRRQSPKPGAQRAGPRHAVLRCARFPRPPARRRGRRSAAPPCPELWQQIQRLRQVDRCEAVTVRIAPCVDPMFFLSQFRLRARARTS